MMKIRNSLTGLLATAALSFFLTLQPAPSYAVDSEKSASYLDSAREFFDEGKYQAAIIELRNSLKADANNVDARLLMAEIYLLAGQGSAAQTEIETARNRGAGKDATALKMARAYLLLRRYDDALAELDGADLPAADIAEGYLVRGDVYMVSNDREKAEESYLEAEKLDPNFHMAKIALSRAALADRDFETANRKIDEAIALKPGDSMAHLTKGLIARANRQTEAAISSYSTALELNPNNLLALIERAGALIDAGRQDEAQTDVDTAYRLSPDNPMAHYLSALLLARAADYEGADAKLVEASALVDSFVPAALVKGYVAYQLGNLEQAATYLSRFVDAFPNHALARQAYGATLLRQQDAVGAVTVLKPLVEQGAEDARSYALLGAAQMQTGDYEAGTRNVELAIEKAPDLTSLRTQLAVGRLALGDSGSAIENLEAVVADDPKQLRAAIMLALIERRQGNYDKAMEAAESIIEEAPENPVGHNIRGAILINLNQLEEARAEFEAALEINQNFFPARSNIAQLERFEGRLDEAERQYRYILNEDRSNTQALVAMAQLASQRGQNTEVIEWLERAVASAPQSSNVRSILIRGHLLNKEFAKARQAAQDAERDFPLNTTILATAGQAYLASESYEEARESYSRLVSQQPQNIEARRILARTQWSLGETDEARGTFVRALSDATGNNSAGILTDLVSLEAQSGNFEEAVAYATDLKKSYPNANYSDLLLGNLYAFAERYDEAIEALNAAKAVADTAQARISLIQTYRKAGRTENAIAEIDDWVKGSPVTPNVRVIAADLYLSLKRYQEALEQYEQIQKAVGDNAIILNNLAWVYHEIGSDKAIETAEKAYQMSPATLQIADTLGWILVNTDKDIDRGLQLLQTAADGMADDGDVRYHLAVAYEKHGRMEEARQQYRLAVNIGDAFDNYETAKERLLEISAQN